MSCLQLNGQQLQTQLDQMTTIDLDLWQYPVNGQQMQLGKLVITL